MELNIKDTIVLEDNIEYVVASKVVYEKQTYYYLVDLYNYKNLRYVYYDVGDQKIHDIEDILLVDALLPKFVLAAEDVILQLMQQED